MVSDEGFGDIFVNALKFGVSNITSLAIWGIAFVVTIIVAVIIMLTAVLIFDDNVIAMIALMLLSYLPVLAVGILMMGFISQCMKTVIDGGSVMPLGLESPAGLAKDGIMTMIIAFEAFIAEMICLAPAFLLMFLAAGSDNTTLMLVAMALMLVAIPVIMVFFLLNMIQWAVYADTGSLLRGLNPLKGCRSHQGQPGRRRNHGVAPHRGIPGIHCRACSRARYSSSRYYCYLSWLLPCTQVLRTLSPCSTGRAAGAGPKSSGMRRLPGTTLPDSFLHFFRGHHSKKFIIY